ncbi:MAG: hypothetical protein B7Z18_10485, partial [Alishewanella sp. 32-51-5]
MNKTTIAAVSALLLLILLWLCGWWVSREPDLVIEEVQQGMQQEDGSRVVGYSTTTALIRVTETLLQKRGGYLANDVLPPFSLLDNMPAWELGALEMSRDLALALRKDLSRSQSQSIENQYLKLAQPMLNIDHRSWAVPAAE